MKSKKVVNLEKQLLGKNNIPHSVATAMRKITKPWMECFRWGIPESVFLW
jgi:hypothetical protein